MNIRIRGKPGQPLAIDGTYTVVVLMRASTTGMGKLASHFPTPPDFPHLFAIYMDQRQWLPDIRAKVMEQGQELVAEGMMRPDPETGTIAVFAQRLDTRPPWDPTTAPPPPPHIQERRRRTRKPLLKTPKPASPKSQ